MLATVVGRAGFAVQNNLFYIKGGYAGVNIRLNVSDTVAPSTGSGGQTHWANGWTVGAGWEYGITRNWIVGLEYVYAAFGSQTYQLGGTLGNYTFDAKPRDIQWAVVRAQLQVRRTGHRALRARQQTTEAKKVLPTLKAPAPSGAFFCRFARRCRHGRDGAADGHLRKLTVTVHKGAVGKSHLPISAPRTQRRIVQPCR